MDLVTRETRMPVAFLTYCVAAIGLSFLLCFLVLKVKAQPLAGGLAERKDGIGSAWDPFCALPVVLPERGMVQPEGTKRMVERLKKLREQSEANPRQSGIFLSDELATFYQQAFDRAMQANNVEEATRLQPDLARQLLNAGQNERALRAFDDFLGSGEKMGRRLDPRSQRQVDLLRALCYLRIGEQENCLTNHTSESCLMPIQGQGVHQLRRGSEGALRILIPHLRTFQGDLADRWLLNIAYMTLGEYPDKVPAEWLIPPRVFASDYDIKRFPDVAGAVGLDVNGLAGGGITEDFDGDGYLDVMASSWGLRDQLRFFRSNGDGTFAERTAEAGLAGLVGGLHIVQTDYNNDDWPDVFIMRGAWLGAGGHHPKSLLRNNGDGTFEDVTETAGLLSMHPSQAVTWFDFDGDGWLDVFIGNESGGAEVHPCELYRNNRNGTFTECGAEAGVAVTGFIKGATSGDYNNDGRPDLYLSDRTGPNFLFRNDGASKNGGWKFTNVAAEAGVTEPKVSFTTWFWDYDNDGWLDIMVTGYAIRSVGDIAADYLRLPNSGERPRLYRNNGNGTFSDATAAANLSKVLHAMGANFGDLDNDGWLDFYVGTGDPDVLTVIPNRMFRNAGGKFFQDVTTSGGFGNIQKGHGVSFADLDNDGDQDVHEVIGGAVSGDRYWNALFLNPGHGNHWITLKVDGERSNRAAIGARIRVIVETPEGERSIYKTVGTGASFGASPLRQEFGLGNAKAIRAVEIDWPVTGRKQTIKGLDLDRFYKVRENESVAISWNLKRFHIDSERATKGQAHRNHPLTGAGGGRF